MAPSSYVYDAKGWPETTTGTTGVAEMTGLGVGRRPVETRNAAQAPLDKGPGTYDK